MNASLEPGTPWRSNGALLAPRSTWLGLRREMQGSCSRTCPRSRPKASTRDPGFALAEGSTVTLSRRASRHKAQGVELLGGAPSALRRDRA
jgi:hypothetical protein